MKNKYEETFDIISNLSQKKFLTWTIVNRNHQDISNNVVRRFESSVYKQLKFILLEKKVKNVTSNYETSYIEINVVQDGDDKILFTINNSTINHFKLQNLKDHCSIKNDKFKLLMEQFV